MKNFIKNLNNKGFNEAIDDLVLIYDNLKKERDYAIEQLNNYNKDKEIQKLKKEIQELKEKNNNCLEFLVTSREREKIDKWINEHAKEKHGGSYYAGAIGGRYSYVFVPTSIGEIGTIKCTCGEKFCFRDLY